MTHGVPSIIRWLSIVAPLDPPARRGCPAARGGGRNPAHLPPCAATRSRPPSGRSTSTDRTSRSRLGRRLALVAGLRSAGRRCARTRRCGSSRARCSRSSSSRASGGRSSCRPSTSSPPRRRSSTRCSRRRSCSLPPRRSTSIASSSSSSPGQRQPPAGGCSSSSRSSTSPEGPATRAARGLVPRPPGPRRLHRRCARGRLRRDRARRAAAARDRRRGRRLARRDRSTPRCSRFSARSWPRIAAALVGRGSGHPDRRGGCSPSARSSSSSGRACTSYGARTCPTTSPSSASPRPSIGRERPVSRPGSADDAPLDRLEDVGRTTPCSGSASSARTSTSSPTSPRRGASSRTSRRRPSRRPQHPGASRTGGCEVAADTGIVGFVLAVSTFATGLRPRAHGRAAAGVRRARRRWLHPCRSRNLERDRDHRRYPARRGHLARASASPSSPWRSSERVLVTGGAGFIGSNLVRALLERRRRGARARQLLDRLARATSTGLEVEIVEGELRSYERVHNAVRGTEVVFHLGALGSVPRSVQDPLTSSAVNVEGTLNVLLAARDEGVRRVVFSSSTSVYGSSRELPTRGGQPPRPDLALRRRQARRRALLHRLLAASTSPSRRSSSATSTSSARARARSRSTPRWFRSSSPRSRPASRSRSTATASSRATSPTSTTSSRRRSPPPTRRARAAASSTSRRDHPRASTTSPTRSGRSSAGRSRSASHFRVRATSATPGPTSRPRARCSATSPPSRSRRGCA